MSRRPDMTEVVPRCNVLFLTLDTLRFDVADRLWREGALPHFAALLSPDGWERRHTPGSFTFAAHQAFFAGFLPTPIGPGPHPRLFAAAFPGSETTDGKTFVFDAATVVEGFAAAGYRTICIGGTGFFNPSTPLGRVLPGLFAERHWSPALSVTDRASTANQFELAASLLADGDADDRVFLFINISALHQPNYFYLPFDQQPADKRDSLASHAAALTYVDACLPVLTRAMKAGGRDWFAIACSDHGTAYGDDGYTGHRLAHPAVWDVPYAHFFVAAGGGAP